MRVLLTGGAGFIGSHICDLCIRNGHELAVLDNLSTGNRDYVPNGAEFHEMDLNDDLEPLFSEFKPEAVIHQAAHASVAVSVREPAFAARQNVLGSINLLEACRRHGVRRVVYASSGAAYGEPKSLPLVEDQIVEPVSPYGVSKYVIEHYLRCYAHSFGIRSVALRYANVYGPRQDPYGEAGVISIFTDLMLNGKQPTIYGDGEQTRDFVYVGDIAAANIAALEQDPDGPHPAVFNVSVNKQTSVNDLFQTLCRSGGFEIEAIYGDPRPGDVLHARLDNSRLCETLDWAPQVELEDGLRRTVEFFRNGSKE